jgi:sporulation protein YlmC with PRC-barrel domain
MKAVILAGWIGCGLVTAAVTVGSDAPREKEAPSAKMYRVSVLEHMPVQNRTGDRLGTITDVAINATEGKLAYLVLSYGEKPGVRPKLFAVPLTALNLEKGNKEYRLDIRSAQLDMDPGFGQQGPPATPDALFGRPNTTSNPNALVRLASDLRKQRVRNPKLEDLGQITDYLIERRNGQIVYTVLTHRSGVGGAIKLFAVPWQALTILPLQGDARDVDLILDVATQTLARREGFNKKDWPTQPDTTLFKNPR